MTPLHIFVGASSIVVVALITSLYFWIKILNTAQGRAKIASRYFATCFLLYAVSQTIVIAQVLGYMKVFGDIPSYGYALAALLFSIGSYYQWKSLT
jgi:hypothetical protein